METFNPLSFGPSDVELNMMMRSRVRSVLKSYNIRTDALAEATQNAIDELRRVHRESGRSGEVRVVVDVPRSSLEVRDNGRGIGLADAKKWLGPDRSSKLADFSRGLVSGHKGVGMTFLAYGFDFFELESRTETGEHYRVTLVDGRKWALGDGADEAPPMARVEISPTNAQLAAPGTSIRIKVGPTTEPKELAKFLNTPEFTATMLETQTAIGTVELDTVPFTAALEFTPSLGPTVALPLNTGFRYPHMGLSADVRVLDLNEVERNHTPGRDIDPELRGSAHAVYRRYTAEEVCTIVTSISNADNLHSLDSLDSLDSLEAFRDFVRHHRVSMYLMSGYSMSLRGMIGAAWSVPGNMGLHKPGVRIATDHQISGWGRDLSLSRSAHNAQRLWLVVHAHNIEPDLGRKDFGPQVKDLVSIAEDAVVEHMLEVSGPYLRPSPTKTKDSVDETDPAVRAYVRRQTPFPFKVPGAPCIPMISAPVEEQDVVGLTNQLMGSGVLGHLRPLMWSATSYDSHFEVAADEVFAPLAHLMGGARKLSSRDRSVVAECKFAADDLLPDLVNGSKRWTDLGLLVCWEAPKDRRTVAGQTLTFSAPLDDAERLYAGVTHLARLSSGGDHVVRVIALKDMLERLAV
jgi:hypothetical protein